MITAISKSTLKKNTGMVIFVGSAARFVTSDKPIAPITNGHKTTLLPVDATVNNANGVRKQPCTTNARASQVNLFSCSFVHQVIKRFQIDMRCGAAYVDVNDCCRIVSIS